MARKRSARSQSKHDKAVERRAKQLERQGFDVKADLKGWKQPGTIRGVRPDIDARKGAKRVIVEVETTESKNDARAQRQRSVFAGAAKRSAKTTFEKIVAVQIVAPRGTAEEIRRGAGVTQRDLGAARKALRSAAQSGSARRKR